MKRLLDGGSINGGTVKRRGTFDNYLQKGLDTKSAHYYSVFLQFYWMTRVKRAHREGHNSTSNTQSIF